VDQDSVGLFERARAGDSLAEQALYDRYVERLIGLARARLSPLLNRRLDPEDVVQSVWRSFFGRLQAGGYTVGRHGDLWRLLAAIAVNKVREKARFNLADRRTVKAEETAVLSRSVCGVPVEAWMSEPSPEEAANLSETLERALKSLSVLKRRIIEQVLQGGTLDEVAVATDCTLRTVQRTRKQFSQHLEHELNPK
jgi:RNA polymerase sigma factor (sigma-70 family)